MLLGIIVKGKEENTVLPQYTCRVLGTGMYPGRKDYYILYLSFSHVIVKDNGDKNNPIEPPCYKCRRATLVCASTISKIKLKM